MSPRSFALPGQLLTNDGGWDESSFKVLHSVKTLMLVRHAKSSWKETGLPDHERPLNKRGRRDAPMMGERLARRGVEVDLMVSSSATRALRTAEVMAEALEYSWDEIVVDERLYEAYAGEILEVIEEQDDWVDHLMLIAHNPGLTTLANHLSSCDIENVPTCGVLALRYDIERWAEVGDTEPVAMYFDYPKKRDGPNKERQ